MTSVGYVVLAVLLVSVAAAPAESDLNTNTTTTEKTKDADPARFITITLMKMVGVMAEDGRFIASGAAIMMDLLSGSGLIPAQKIQRPLDQQAIKQAANACESVLNDNFNNNCQRPMQITECVYAEYDKIVTLKRRQTKAAAATFTCRKFDDKDPCHKSCWLTSFGVLDEAGHYNDRNASDLVAISYPDLSAENIEKTVKACNSVDEHTATGCELAAQITTCFGEQYSKITGKQA